MEFNEQLTKKRPRKFFTQEKNKVVNQVKIFKKEYVKRIWYLVTRLNKWVIRKFTSTWKILQFCKTFYSFSRIWTSITMKKKDLRSLCTIFTLCFRHTETWLRLQWKYRILGKRKTISKSRRINKFIPSTKRKWWHLRMLSEIYMTISISRMIKAIKFKIFKWSLSKSESNWRKLWRRLRILGFLR